MSKKKRKKKRKRHQAKMYEFRENYQGAAKVFEKIFSLRPHTPSSYVNLALVYAKMKKFDEAIHVLEQGIERIPDSEILLSRLGHTYLVLGRLKKAISIHPTPLAFYNLAVALRKAGNLKEATHYLKL
jgi:tetratricopeptide (TPR) repeat protein